ncbi:hypothetical protein D5b_00496 [Faustovirus]|nr:hypothetical protein D5b_00496 [Faustovirus]AMN84425.1 hypothetical protein D6_00012 [Faustovirus]AMP44434.1 hypothetical protein PRJ_Dakar_00484 [Faustovirus]
MDSLPCELIIEITKHAPESYCAMLATSRRLRGALMPRRGEFLNYIIHHHDCENHTYATLGPDPNGTKHGLLVLYLGRIGESKKMFEVSYKRGMIHGTERYYNIIGDTIYAEQEYEDGVRHGTETTYYNTGSISRQRTWVNGELRGSEFRYTVDGELSMIYNW